MLLERGESVYIYLNYSLDSLVYSALKKYGRLKIIGNGANDGLGIAISAIARTAYSDGYSAIIFFDQDTIFSHATAHAVHEHIHKALSYGQYSVIQMVDKSHFLIKNKLLLPPIPSFLTINSGSIFNLKVLNSIGFHNESYFVDGVDYEFCFRSSLYGYYCGLTNLAPDIDHRSGQDDTEVQVFGRNIRLRRYSITRFLDYNKSITRLIFEALKTLRFKYLLIFAKNMAVYNLLYFSSYIFIRR